MFRDNMRTILIITITILLTFVVYYAYISQMFWYVYEKNIYSPEVFKRIESICDSISMDMCHHDEKTKRLIFPFAKNHIIYTFVYNKDFIDKVRKITGVYDLVPGVNVNVNIEYRKYLTGSEIDWHADEKEPDVQVQYECVLTLTNTSNSETEVDVFFRNKKITTEPNSLIVLRANGIDHRVTKCTSGERTILKISFFRDGK